MHFLVEISHQVAEIGVGKRVLVDRWFGETGMLQVFQMSVQRLVLRAKRSILVAVNISSKLVQMAVDSTAKTEYAGL